MLLESMKPNYIIQTAVQDTKILSTWLGLELSRMLIPRHALILGSLPLHKDLCRLHRMSIRYLHGYLAEVAVLEIESPGK